ncbi:CS1 type fimbrial major subunit [Aeromonas veronii]|uniref:CS1 type fimbrial major subunit n=1 Tax=Aeromonas TaxID=642 RepID=UPI001E31AF96|nr:CS1 type fimbrial major subunit [Aeromonas veronii]MCD6617662.1 fimbrial protein [Aeromonas veronii]MCF5855064.1 fimbrial protein [Aeromonas veronii]
MKMLSLFPALLLASGSLIAAERIEHTVTVTAQIPTENFYVQPVGDWMNTPQKLAFNSFNNKLEPLAKQLDMKSTIGPIKGYLLYPSTIISGKESIGVTVKVAGVELTTSSKDLLNQADANTGKKVGFEIIPAAAPAGGYKPGNYQGIVSMMFESEAPSAPPAQGS